MPSATPPDEVSVQERSPQLALAFDFGRRRIGVACGDTKSGSANPLTAVLNTDSGPRWDQVDSLVQEWGPTLMVVGLPYHADGSESAMGLAARAFAEALRRRYGTAVHLIDERYSSLEAQTRLQALRAMGLRKARVSKPDIDAAAACVILERWFNRST